MGAQQAEQITGRARTLFSRALKKKTLSSSSSDPGMANQNNRGPYNEFQIGPKAGYTLVSYWKSILMEGFQPLDRSRC